ncbi:adenylosuccinate synthase [candidate division LCP-89 bacterium B3_LCP]|uniref:Adenylosuccinate synthetase n=1 Tax=candidate division LCP-89 bacterium B3_LCP TaxID=2012998 RepID=A0A532UUD5_UNCL8|nr:MAG: adenylosuccinate synthase [candidate division LCP-89 bacterium B3_LCP]
MPVIAVIGAQWGDEGKGKIVDLFAEKADVVVRSQGGANAGHTIQRDGQRIVLHLLPSGILTPSIKCLIGTGVVLDPDAFLQEISEVEALGINLKDRIVLDYRTHLVFPTHKLIEACQEEARAGEMIGTTRRGIGPAYSDKAARRGVRVGDLLDKNIREKICNQLYDQHAALLDKLYGKKPPERGEFLRDAERWADALHQYAGDAVHRFHEALDAEQTILLEGAQGVLLDLDLGTYPFVTSSHPSIGGPVLGIGMPPQRIDFTLGVIKAYCTRVGSGPFPTEMDDDTTAIIRESGAEFGSTTGRPRRCGWLDLFVAKHVARWNGFDGWAVTKVDVLDGVQPLRACIGYQIRGKVQDSLPATQAAWNEAEPVYGNLKGWSDTRSKKKFEALPKGALEYLETIEKFTQVPVHLISLGADRDATILPRGEIF